MIDDMQYAGGDCPPPLPIRRRILPPDGKPKPKRKAPPRRPTKLEPGDIHFIHQCKAEGLSLQKIVDRLKDRKGPPFTISRVMIHYVLTGKRWQRL